VSLIISTDNVNDSYSVNKQGHMHASALSNIKLVDLPIWS